MKSTARMGELFLRLKLDQDFRELWAMICARRDAVIEHAIHADSGDPAENRGAARELDKMVKAIEESPKKIELAKLNQG